MAESNHPIANLPGQFLPQAGLLCLNGLDEPRQAGFLLKFLLSHLGISLQEINVAHQEPPYSHSSPDESINKLGQSHVPNGTLGGRIREDRGS
jgi:hypothetical protein